MKNVIWNFIKQNEICMVDFGLCEHSVIKGMHPSIIVQNNKCNHYSPCTQVVPLFEASECNMWRINLSAQETKLNKVTIAYCDYLSTIDKCRIIEKLGELSQDAIKKLYDALMDYFCVII